MPNRVFGLSEVDGEVYGCSELNDGNLVDMGSVELVKANVSDTK